MADVKTKYTVNYIDQNGRIIDQQKIESIVGKEVVVTPQDKWGFETHAATTSLTLVEDETKNVFNFPVTQLANDLTIALHNVDYVRGLASGRDISGGVVVEPGIVSPVIKAGTVLWSGRQNGGQMVLGFNNISELRNGINITVEDPTPANAKYNNSHVPAFRLGDVKFNQAVPFNLTKDQLKTGNTITIGTHTYYDGMPDISPQSNGDWFKYTSTAGEIKFTMVGDSTLQVEWNNPELTHVKPYVGLDMRLSLFITKIVAY
ncbi:hypothetical protein ACNAN0_03950 [Agrilactobacillus fermenti]|uniref:hypothetical protein n=1 Tax=Agrilactobacillus fermenti TaxID=2586909 RepID=UPI003A5C4E3B